MSLLRVLRTGAVVTCAAVAWAMLLFAAPSSAAVSMAVSAGIDGVVKADRWTPVRVAVTSGDPELAAQLLLSWGDATLRRDIALPSPGTRTFELYLRTSEAAGVVHVRLRSASAELASVDVPVRVLPREDLVTICVSASPAAVGGSCSATVAPDALPFSPRGYEVVDRVLWPSGDEDGPRWASLSPEQRAAFDQWQAMRRLDETGDLSLTPQAARPSVRAGLPSRVAAAIATAAAIYILCLACAGATFVRRRSSAWRAYVTLLVAITVGSGAALTIGRTGPVPSLQVRHASVLQQIPGAGSLLTIRGIAEFPAFDSYALTLSSPDATIEAATASGRAEQRLDENGHPVLTGTFALGARRAFMAEVVTDVQPIAVAVDGSAARITNQSNWPLHDCRSADGASAGEAGVLLPGASITVAHGEDGSGPLLTCTMSRLPVDFHEDRRAIEASGPTIVAAFRPSRTHTGTAQAGTR